MCVIIYNDSKLYKLWLCWSLLAASQLPTSSKETSVGGVVRAINDLAMYMDV